MQNKLFTIKDMKVCFEAAREQTQEVVFKQHPEFENVRYWDSRKYETFEDYLKTISHE